LLGWPLKIGYGRQIVLIRGVQQIVSFALFANKPKRWQLTSSRIVATQKKVWGMTKEWLGLHNIIMQEWTVTLYTKKWWGIRFKKNVAG
jgi:hypothetical protein